MGTFVPFIYLGSKYKYRTDVPLFPASPKALPQNGSLIALMSEKASPPSNTYPAIYIGALSVKKISFPIKMATLSLNM